MPSSTGYILFTPLQSWSRATEKHSSSLLAKNIEYAMARHSSYIVVENVIGLQKSVSLKTVLGNLKEVGYTANVLEITDKTIIVGKK